MPGVASAVERWLVARWYDPEAGASWLAPLEWLFRAVSGARRRAYRSGLLPVHRVGAPVVVVGNVTVGGTGKTPLVLWLAQALRARGRRPGIVSRGYGGRAGPGVLRVDANSDPARAGDEALLLARRSGCPIAVAADRVAAARALVADGVDVVVADDGLQHYRLAREVEIVVLDGERGFGNGRCLPAGPLREPVSRIADADAVVVHQATQGGAAHLVPDALPMQMRARAVVPLAGGPERTLEDFAGKRVHAVAGIGNPGRYFDWLRTRGLDVVPHAFPDHAHYAPGDLDFGDGLPVLMTEKDAVKCTRFAGPQHWYVSVDAVFAPADAERLLAVVASAWEEAP